MGFWARLLAPRSVRRAPAGQSGGKSKAKVTQVWIHGNCQVRHRTAEAAARCRNS